MSDPLIVQCAVTGSADPDPQRRPNLPVTSEQIIDEALAAWPRPSSVAVCDLSLSALTPATSAWPFSFGAKATCTFDAASARRTPGSSPWPELKDGVFDGSQHPRQAGSLLDELVWWANARRIGREAS